MILESILAWLYWDPPRVVFFVPFIHHPVVWYGVLFASGFILSYLLLIKLFRQKIRSLPLASNQTAESINELSRQLVDQLTWYVVIGTIIGARLGHVFFYDWEFYSVHPLEIFKVWEGGLASHGGTVGVFIAMVIYYRTIIRKALPEITFLGLLDLFCVPVPLASCFIRLGNFMNQEIIGPPTTVPWAVIFGHPFEAAEAVPRHPTQLYEALAYLFTFAILCYLWNKKRDLLPPGTIVGWMFLLIFGSRFFIEFVKLPQELYPQATAWLQTGQYLSLPFILAGLLLVLPRKKLSRLV